jgi:hypothetical protein
MARWYSCHCQLRSRQKHSPARAVLPGEQYESCLSFFDVRGLAPRSPTPEVEHQEADGQRRITVFQRGMLV